MTQTRWECYQTPMLYTLITIRDNSIIPTKLQVGLLSTWNFWKPNISPTAIPGCSLRSLAFASGLSRCTETSRSVKKWKRKEPANPAAQQS